MPTKNQPMHGFLRGTLTPHEVFDRLKEDFARDGKNNVTPSAPFYADPPDGLGYSGPQEFQLSFLNSFVNSRDGKSRYNQPQGDDVLASEVKPTPTVGNLTLRIFSDQNK
jgi:hypothetical protein